MFTIRVEYLFLVVLVGYIILSYKYRNEEEEEFND
jgi:hypothetical protein